MFFFRDFLGHRELQRSSSGAPAELQRSSSWAGAPLELPLELPRELQTGSPRLARRNAPRKTPMSKKISWPLEIDALSESIPFGRPGSLVVATKAHRSPTGAQLELPRELQRSSSGAPAEHQPSWSSAGAPDAPKNLEKKQSQEMTIIRKNFS